MPVALTTEYSVFPDQPGRTIVIGITTFMRVEILKLSNRSDQECDAGAARSRITLYLRLYRWIHYDQLHSSFVICHSSLPSWQDKRAL